MQTVKRIEFLDGIRAIAALFVFFSHAWYHIWPAVLPPYGYGYRPTGLVLSLTSWLYYGHFAVVVFVVLSGFCLMLPVINSDGFLRGGTLRFFQRRFKRILPPYYCCLLLSLIFIGLFIGTKTGTQWDISLPVTVDGIIAHILMLQDFITPTQINYVLWSVAMEFQLYFFFPLLVISWRRFGCLATTLGTGVFIYSTIFWLEINRIQDVPPSFIGLCYCFVLGMLAASIVFSEDKHWQKLRKYLPWRIFVLLSISAVIFFCYLWGFDLAEKRFHILDIIFAFGIISLIVALFNPENQKIANLLASKPLKFISSFSYSLYLIHAPLLQIIWQYVLHPFNLSKTWQFIWLLALGTPLIFFVAYAFYIYCEKQFLNLVKK
jgi:peptidoglycan/LPS O-acetylase OafA/YrhL